MPTLDANMQAERIEPPARKWGTIARTAPMPGTYHFYGWDLTFTGLIRDPLALVRSGCRTAIEPNFTIETETPKALAIERIYRKRWLARTWQENGVRVLVDMNTPLDDLCLLGVPAGWRAYATRKHKCCPITMVCEDYDRAVRHAGTRQILFAVYGGGRKMRDFCARHGWVWCPEHAHVARGIESEYVGSEVGPCRQEEPRGGQVRVGHGRA